MALFGKRGADASGSGDWTPVAIHILESVFLNDERGGDGGVLTNLIEMVAESGGEPYAFVLEIRPADGEPYRVEHREKVQKSASGGLFSRTKIPSGVDVAGWVKVGDPKQVRIDWTSLRSSPEAAAAVEDASVAEADRGYALYVLAKQKPKVQEQLRAAAWSSVWGLAPLVAAGNVSREQWERDAQSNLRKTLITPEQYAQALAVVEGGSSDS